MSLLDSLTETMQSGGIKQISSQLGLEQEQVSTVVAGALPTLIGALSKNSASSSGASLLASALDRDHDGSILDDLAGFLGGGGGNQPAPETAGAGILGHLLGSRQGSVESTLGKMSGLDKSSVAQILMMLAPVVMGALGKAKRERDLDAGGLADLLGGERQKAEAAAPGAAGLLGSLLDQDGDGEVGDDLAKLGGSLLGSLFGKR